MDHPEIWIRLCTHIHQDFLVIYGDYESGISEFSAVEDFRDRIALTRHIRALVDSDLTEDQLLEMWDQSGAQIGPANGSMRAFLTMLLDLLEANKS